MRVSMLVEILKNLPPDAEITMCFDGLYYKKLFSVTQTEPDVVLFDNDNAIDE